MKVRDVLLKDIITNLPDNTMQELHFLNIGGKSFEPLNTIQEGNTTESLLSNFSYLVSEDDLDSVLKANKPWKKHRTSRDLSEPAVKKRRSSGNKIIEIANNEKVVGTITLMVNKNGPITATWIIESVPTECVDKTPKQQPIKLIQYPTELKTSQKNLIYNMWQQGNTPDKKDKNAGLRQHSFSKNISVLRDYCGFCDKKIGFNSSIPKTIV